MVEPLRPDRVTDHKHTIHGHTRAPDPDCLPLGYTDDAVHASQEEPVQRIVEADLEGRGRPAPGDRDGR